MKEKPTQTTRTERALLLSLLLGAVHPAQAQTPSVPTLPRFSHVFVFVFENSSAESILGNRRLPTFNALAQEGALATNSHGVTHPSLPNYLALIAGTYFGTHSDDPAQTFHGPTLPDALEKANLSWKGYFQSLPRAGFTGNYGGTGNNYVKRHNPFLLFPSIAGNPQRAARSVPLGQLKADLRAGRAPNFALVVPDLCTDLHGNVGCPGKAALYARADTFLREWVAAIRSSSAWDDHAAIVITFDESEGSDRRGGGGRIPTIVLTRTGPAGFRSAVNYNHYSLLRTLTDAWSLAPIGEAAQASPMTDLFVKP